MFSTNNNSEIDVDISYTMYGECRCCLGKGQHRDVTKEYYYNNIKEVYKDIFLECFNLSLSPHNLISCLICDSCVHRLRDASSFRMMVVSTEEQLLKAVIFKSEPDNDSETEYFDGRKKITTEVKIECKTENIDFDPDDSFLDIENIDTESADIFGDDDNVDTESTDIIPDGQCESENIDTESANISGDVECGSKKVDTEPEIEEQDSESSTDFSSDEELIIDENEEDAQIEYTDYETDFDDCASSSSSNITISTTSELDDEPCEVIDGEPELLARFPKSLQRLPKRSELSKICPEYYERLKKLDGILIKTDLKDKLISDKQKLAINAATIFEYSNATAFKTKARNGYPCFYCQEVHKHDKLREHQAKHPKSSIYKLLQKFNADEFVVYADITNLKCTICKKKMKSLKVLKTHLSEKHAKKIYECKDRVVPFKLKDSNFNCQICDKKFESFGRVEKHMNTHFSNFTCETCGTGFITKHRLAVHTYAQHAKEKVQCSDCKKSFESQMKYRLHYDGVHKNVKKYKCTKCSERFINYFTRQKHMVDVHDEAPRLYKCNDCEKSFNRRFGLTDHVKRCHKSDKNIKCQKCSYKCYTKSELKDHMIKHGGTESFECTICKKVYNRSRSLTAHMKKHK